MTEEEIAVKRQAEEFARLNKKRITAAIWGQAPFTKKYKIKIKNFDDGGAVVEYITI